jgi:hypothetical protein
MKCHSSDFDDVNLNCSKNNASTKVFLAQTFADVYRVVLGLPAKPATKQENKEFKLNERV